MPRTIIFVIAVCLALVRAAPSPAKGIDTLLTPIGKVAPFELTDQKGRTVTLRDLRGKVWVASFFFSTCKECNATVVKQLARLQKELAAWPDILLVSISVFPERDTKEQLGLFAKNNQVDARRWLLLRGERAAIERLATKSFKQSVFLRGEPFFFVGSSVGLHSAPFGCGPLLTVALAQVNREGKDYLPYELPPQAEVGHAWNFMLVDHFGVIRGSVDGRHAPEVDRLAQRVKELVWAKYLPSINAVLNGLCGILLIVGFVAIRQRKILFHKVCMIAALVVSAIFLTSYLYYHLVIQHGEPTYFTGAGAARWIYFSVLLSHTILAAVVAPLALITGYLGIRDRLRGHVAIARWTLPIWLYVSATGVIVYWMLYHLYPPG